MSGTGITQEYCQTPTAMRLQEKYFCEIVLSGMFATLMSTIDSTFNSLATMWSIDIYSKYFNKNATDSQKINSGRMAIVFSLCTALLMSMVLLYLKFDSPESAFTHTLNNLRYYINCGIVVLIISAIFLIKPKVKVILMAFIMTIPVSYTHLTLPTSDLV